MKAYIVYVILLLIVLIFAFSRWKKKYGHKNRQIPTRDKCPKQYNPRPEPKFISKAEGYKTNHTGATGFTVPVTTAEHKGQKRRGRPKKSKD